MLQELTGKEVYIYSGVHALEGVAKIIRSPEYLVFATHGYFLPDPEGLKTEYRHSLNSNNIIATNALQRSMETYLASLPTGFKPLDLSDPFVRSGLLLAGANHSDQWGEVRSCEGILTALEASLIDLRGTKLVVLSACETGVGEVKLGEGVAGLRQAFQLAGARSVVASLWQVPDIETSELMVAFFTNIKSGDAYPIALRKAQLSQLAKRKELYGTAHPYYWAAFTLTGR